ncbi:hypothetical protein [Algibacter lectus]|uniref:hypothetical protein n=1 Tax=Algibacter lectus TaxID=221126 RepID=UPI0026EBF3A7|nr:hypothetical protein [Algibacter lectus]MDO7138780.1 hypothetical protein [Algibacter lectus]
MAYKISVITAVNSPHLVVYNPEYKQGKLLFFMPGTGGIVLSSPKQNPNIHNLSIFYRFIIKIHLFHKV